MRRVRGPLFPLFRHPLAPLSRSGRVVVLVLLAIWAFCLSVAWSPAHADDAQAAPAEGPYFQLPGADPALDRLPLKATRVEVRIAGVIADVAVTQHYRNEGQRAIEARYVFPGSTRAAVHAMQVRLGDRVLHAQIDEKQRARIRHENAKREGKTSALLEQERPNVFQMAVANILPGDEVQVELRYTELIVPTEGRYEFVFPTVVGPRYHVPSTAGGPSRFPASAHLAEGEASKAAFDLHVVFAAPLPVSALRSPSHGIEVQGEGTAAAEVALNDAGERADRDFILEYRLAGERTATGLTLFRADRDGGADGQPGENFFLAVVEPPRAIAPAQINPREYVFVVDISGSMHGHPLATAKTLLRNLIGGLRASDSFNVLLFSGSSQMLSPTPVPATRANIERAIATIDAARGGGSTEIVPALRRIAALPKNADVSRCVIVVTDGYVTVENQVFELVRSNLGNSNVFAFGIGTAVNRHLIEGIARAGQGEPFIVTRPELAAAQAERLRKMIEAPVLTGLRARFEGLEVYDVEPAALDALPDVLGGRPVLISGKWRGEPRGQLVLEGHAASGTHRDVVPVVAPDVQASALRQLWARSRIQQLSDQEALEGGSGRRDEITALGLRYALLTQYTSFIAVDQRVRTSGEPAAVDQPLPLPQGVGKFAVGGVAEVGAAVPSTPEPAAWLSLLVVLALVGAALSGRGKW